MKNNFHRWVLMLFIILPSLLKANLIKVNDLGDPTPAVAGNKNLRDAIIAAAPGDTVIMDIKGNITLTSNLVINKPITIVGAYPVHNTITLAPGVEIQFNFAGAINFSGFRITGSGLSSTSALRILSGTYLAMNDCVLENISSTSNGGAVFVSGQLSASYCAFINNQSSLEGGAVYMSNATFADFNSCTFGTNSAAQGGGAIYCSGSLQVNNCTFANNNAATAGRDIKSNLSGALVTSFNSIYAHSSGGPVDFYNGSGSWFSFGGNSFTATPGGGTFSSGLDQTVSPASLGLTALYTDGYGMRYYRLIPGSVAIDFGQTSGGTLPAKDCRRAPRTLFRTVLKPDCGAFEFTPYTVVNTSGSSATSGSFPYHVSQIAATGNPGPYFIDFGIGSPATIISAAPMLLNKPQTIIDGYTEALSMVPGPGTSAGTVTPAVMGFNVQSGSTLNDILDVSNLANNTSISGLGFYSAYYGLAYLGSSNAQIFGNYFYGMTQAGIYANVASGIMVGGERHFQRNIISNSVTGLNTLQTSNVKIQGNFIGTDDIGMNPTGSGNGTGIYAVQANGMLVGGDHFRGRGNIISGTITHGIQLGNSSNIAIQGNYIGLNYNGTGAIENHYNGIYINGSGANIRIGRNGKAFRNYICNSDLSNVNNGAAIKVDSYTGGDLRIFNNSLGVDKNNVNAPNGSGITIINSGNVWAGDGSIQHRNVICNSLNNGIYIDGSLSSGAYINKNFIGLREDNSPGPNNSRGVYVVNNVANGTIINNVISGNVASGVELSTCGSNNSVSGNFIGTDSTGNIPVGNAMHGIWADNLSSGLLMFSNIISGNGINGVNLINTTNAVLYNNVIGLNISQSAAIPNQNGIRAIGCPNIQIGTSTNGNTISGNTNSGVYISNGNGFVIVRNFIGTNPSEASGLGNGQDGIYMDGTSMLGTIGNIGTTGDSNTVMFNGRHGVFVDGSSHSTGINKNHFAGNVQKGIALTNGGPLANDTDDADGGGLYGNDGQNYPVLTIAQRCGTDTKIAGSINVDAMGFDYHLEFYSVGTPDGSGHGEGLHFLGEIILNDPSSHTIPFSFGYPGLLPVGTIITSTCTKRPGGGVSSTSEFSNNVTVVPAFTADAIVTQHESCYGDANGETHVDALGGVPAYNYNWILVGGGSVGSVQDNYGLYAGFYTAQVTDATGCQVYSDTIQITQPAQLLATPTTTSETCAGLNDGTFTITPTGGTLPYTFVIYNSASTPVGSNSGTTATFTGLADDTYTVTTTDANGCALNSTATVTPGITVTANFTATPATICAGGNVSFTDLSTGGTSWFWDFGDFTNSTSPTPPAHTYATSGSYNVQLTLTNGTCSNVFSTTITVNAPYTLNAGPDVNICETSPTVTLSGTTAAPTVNWSSSGGGSFSAPTALVTNYTLSAAELSGGTANIVFTVTDGVCTSTDAVVITVDKQPTVAVGADDVACEGTPYTLTGSVGFTATQTWTATGGGTFTNQFGTVTDYTTGLTSGNDTLSLVTGTNGACNAQADYLILTISPAPTVNAGPDLQECSTTVFSSTLNGTVTGASSTLWTATQIVTWSGSTSSTTVDAIYSGAAVSSGSMYFILTATSPGCAPVDDSVHVVFTAPHSAYAGPDAVVCSSSLPVALVGPGITGPTGVTSTWSGAGTFSPSASTLTGVTYTPTAGEITAGTATVTLTTDPLGACAVASDAMTITILAAPVADAGTDQSVCSGNVATLNGSGSTGSITTYQWNELSGPAVGSTVSVNVTPTANTSYILTVDNGTCSDADTVAITLTTSPDASFTYTGPFCVGAGIQAATVITSGGTFGVVGSTTGISLNAVTGDVDLSTSTAGTYDVYYQLTSPCTNSDTVSIVIHNPPVVTASEVTNDTVACPLDTLYFTGSPAGGTFSPLTALNTVTGQYLAIFPGSYSAIYNYTDGTTGCSSSDAQNFVIHTPPAVSYSPSLASTYCTSDGPILLTGTPGGVTGGFAYNGTIIPGNTYNYDPNTPGTDSIAYGYMDPVTGCANYMYQVVTVTTAPATPILTTAAPYEFCESNPQTLTVSNPATFVSWYNDAGLTSVITTGVNCSSSLLGDGSNTMYVVNKTSGSCVSAPLAVSYINHTFTGFSFGGPYETCSGTPIEIQMTTPVNTFYGWLPDPTLSDTAAIHPMVSPGQTTTYTVMVWVTSMPSCVMYDSVTVVVKPCSLDDVTNAFSPDGDGVNDTWIIEGIEQHPQNRVTLFNRWGDKMIQLDGYNNSSVVWDGMYKGTKAAAGTYYFVIEYLDDGQQAAGWLQLNY